MSHDFIMMSGAPRSGKSSVADHLIQHYGYHGVGFADTLRLACATALNTTPEKLAASPKGIQRTVLQAVGHNARYFDPDVWVNKLAGYLDTLQKQHESHILSDGHPFRVVVTDTRYINEVQWGKARSYKLIRLDRPQNEVLHQMVVENPTVDAAVLQEQMAHPVEHDLDEYRGFDYNFLSRKGRLNFLIALVVDALELEWTEESRRALSVMAEREAKGLSPF